jgi:hypothetical protein
LEAPEAAEFLDHAKLGRQVDVVGNLGEVAHNIMARGRSERFAGCEIQFYVAAQLVDRAAPLARNLAQRIPGGVFKVSKP